MSKCIKCGVSWIDTALYRVNFGEFPAIYTCEQHLTPEQYREFSHVINVDVDNDD